MICIVTQQKPTQNYKTVSPIKNTSINFLKSNLVLLPECQHCLCVCVCVCVYAFFLANFTFIYKIPCLIPERL